MCAWFLQEDLAAKSRNLLSLKIRQGEGGKTHTYSTKPMKLVLSLSTSFQYSNLPKKYCKSFIFKFIVLLWLWFLFWLHGALGNVRWLFSLELCVWLVLDDGRLFDLLTNFGILEKFSIGRVAGDFWLGRTQRGIRCKTRWVSIQHYR